MLLTGRSGVTTDRVLVGMATRYPQLCPWMVVLVSTVLFSVGNPSEKVGRLAASLPSEGLASKAIEDVYPCIKPNG